MRTIIMSILALAICSLNLLAAPADPKPAEPTDDQLAAAKEAYAKLGATHQLTPFGGDPQTNQRLHLFSMPATTTDADLKACPTSRSGSA
jgi:hypothetical protein